MYAARNGYPDIVQLLIDAGAKVNASNHNGKTALMMAAQCHHDIRDAKIMVVKLLNANANVNATDKEGKTALMYAESLFGKSSIVAEILRRVAALKT